MDFFFVDKILPFLKKNKNINQLEKLNIFQFYLCRFGIGINISNKIISFSGISASYKIKNYTNTVINTNIKSIFLKIINSLDLNLEQKMIKRIKNDIKLYTYRGDRYKLRLPLHGQRRRANGKTVKKIRQYILH